MCEGKKLSFSVNQSFFNWRGDVEINDNQVVVGGKAGILKWFLDFSCGGGWLGVENETNANSGWQNVIYDGSFGENSLFF